MSILYEQFFAVGSVKSLLTGENLSLSNDNGALNKSEPAAMDSPSSTLPLPQTTKLQTH